ncbi:MAG TPA: glycine zipper 2TM domain-containing protein [Ramlibacter sp.]|nr:glycine zipper 2TM domain-containing protein [Ramlibacter sp.]
MKKFLLATFVFSAGACALAQGPAQPAPAAAGRAKVATAAALCHSCGTVQEVKQVKRKGEGGAAGIVGGAVVGGLLGNQIGKGSGNTVATVGGAVAGGFAGNEVQKHVTSKKVWITRVRMKDGSIRSFEQETPPKWAAGQVVRVQDKTLSKV